MQIKLLLIPTKKKLVPRKFAFGCKFLVLTNQDDDDDDDAYQCHGSSLLAIQTSCQSIITY